jgi:hypothetical protein
MTKSTNKSVTWKIVPDFPHYEVSEHGGLRHGTKHLKPERVQGSGRKRFALSKNGRCYRILAHRLVALAFIGPKPFDGAEVCHRDGFIHNNHFSNLRWDTQTANDMDCVRHRIERQEKSGRKCGRSSKPQQLAAAYSEFIARNAGQI